MDATLRRREEPAMEDDSETQVMADEDGTEEPDLVGSPEEETLGDAPVRFR